MALQVSSRDGAPADDDAHLVRMLAEPVWCGIAELRGALHWTGRCRVGAAPYSPQDPYGAGAGCAECVDEHSEILALVIRRYRVRRQELANPCGWARTVAKRLACDRIRTRRAEQGALARPERARGAVAWIVDRCPSPWHVRLVHLILDEVGKPTPVPADVWPYDRWLAERIRCTGEPASERARRALRTEVAEALALIRRYPGPVPANGRAQSWAERYVDTPLGRRPRLDTVSLDAARPGMVDVAEPEFDLHLAAARSLYQQVLDDVAGGESIDRALGHRLPARFGQAAARLLADRSCYQRLVSGLSRWVAADLRSERET